jgi:hypothetical protein
MTGISFCTASIDKARIALAILVIIAGWRDEIMAIEGIDEETGQ